MFGADDEVQVQKFAVRLPQVIHVYQNSIFQENKIIF